MAKTAVIAPFKPLHISELPRRADAQSDIDQKTLARTAAGKWRSSALIRLDAREVVATGRFRRACSSSEIGASRQFNTREFILPNLSGASFVATDTAAPTILFGSTGFFRSIFACGFRQSVGCGLGAGDIGIRNIGPVDSLPRSVHKSHAAAVRCDRNAKDIGALRPD